MRLSDLAHPPEGMVLQTAILTTFDLDLSFLSALLPDFTEGSQVLVFYGQGRFRDGPPESAGSPRIRPTLIPVFFPPAKEGKPVAYAHGKLWLFVFSDGRGERLYRLSVHSSNLYPDDNLECQVVFSGRDTGQSQPKSRPLADTLTALQPFAGQAAADHPEALRALHRVTEALSAVRFEPLPAYACEDYEFIGPWMDHASFLRGRYDELLVICPFLSRKWLSLLAEDGSAAAERVVVTNLSAAGKLLSAGETKALILPQEKTRPYIHAKIFLLRRGDDWDLYCGSMNLTTYAMGRNMEFMVHLKNPSFIQSVEGFLASFLGLTERDVRERLCREVPSVLASSPVFASAASPSIRIRVLSHFLQRANLSVDDADGMTAYVLSPECTFDLARLLRGEAVLSPPVCRKVRKDGKEREVYLPPLRERMLLSLINQALHCYDGCFSTHLYSHIAGRAPAYALSRIREMAEFEKLWLLKADVRSYDPSMDAALLGEALRELPEMDPCFCSFAGRLLSDRAYLYEDEIHTDGPAVKTGNPLNGFFENAYLRHLDAHMERRAAFYARYADDILIGGRTREELAQLEEEARQIITSRKLSLHEDKTRIIQPGDAFSYLGWQIRGNRVDFLPEEIERIRRFVRSETRRLIKECRKRDLAPVFRQDMVVSYADVLIERFALTDAFSVISVPDGLREIDRLLCDMIRAVVSGRVGRAKYRIRYRELRRWGYSSLVSRWYRFLKEKEQRQSKNCD